MAEGGVGGCAWVAAQSLLISLSVSVGYLWGKAESSSREKIGLKFN